MLLWAEDVSYSAAGLIALSTALIGAAVSAVVTLMSAWSKNRQQARADAIAEWQRLVDRQQEDINNLEKMYKELLDRVTKCEVERAELRTELRMQEVVIRRLQVRTGDESPVTIVSAIVVADAHGIIMVSSPALTPILHWLPADLKGKSVEVLMPDRYKEKHRAALTSAMLRDTPPWPDRPLMVHALTKEGAEVPVSIALSGWRTEKGDWLLSAEVRLRQQEQAVDGSN
jgi:PAS domain S-box-containing protein